MSVIETPDIFRGAYLLCCGARVSGTHLRRNQVLFVIEGEGVAEHDERYRLGLAVVNPIALRETLNFLRDLVFERLRMEKNTNVRTHRPGTPKASEALR